LKPRAAKDGFSIFHNMVAMVESFISNLFNGKMTGLSWAGFLMEKWLASR
jgi:hypothetical protein